jgi:hypothetical protein
LNRGQNIGFAGVADEVIFKNIQPDFDNHWILKLRVFAYISFRLGGSAVNGKVEAGKYFLGEHGKYTEVSRSVYDSSRIHTYSLFITHPMAIIAILAYGVMKEDEKRDRATRDQKVP